MKFADDGRREYEAVKVESSDAHLKQKFVHNKGIHCQEKLWCKESHLLLCVCETIRIGSYSLTFDAIFLVSLWKNPKILLNLQPLMLSKASTMWIKLLDSVNWVLIRLSSFQLFFFAHPEQWKWSCELGIDTD